MKAEQVDSREFLEPIAMSKELHVLQKILSIFGAATRNHSGQSIQYSLTGKVALSSHQPFTAWPSSLIGNTLFVAPGLRGR